MGIDWFSADYNHDKSAVTIGSCSFEAWADATPALEAMLRFIAQHTDTEVTLDTMLEDRSGISEIILTGPDDLDAVFNAWQGLAGTTDGWSLHAGAMSLLQRWTSGRPDSSSGRAGGSS